MFVDSEEQNWFKWTHVRKFLGLSQIEKLLVGLDKCEIRVRKDFEPTCTTATGWSGPKDHQNKTDKFLSLFRIMYVIVKSKKGKGKALKKQIMKEIVPRGFNARIEGIKEKHQHAIEEKDATIALLNDDLKNCEHDNEVLQAQRDVYKDQLQKCQDNITHLKKRYAPHAKDPGKDNIVTIIEENTAPEEDEFYEYPYYIARIQRRFINTKKR